MFRLEEARASAQVAWQIYDLRTKAGLSQRELAKLVGTTASVICRLEDEDCKATRLPCSGASLPRSTSALRFALCPLTAS